MSVLNNKKGSYRVSGACFEFEVMSMSRFSGFVFFLPEKKPVCRLDCCTESIIPGLEETGPWNPIRAKFKRYFGLRPYVPTCYVGLA